MAVFVYKGRDRAGGKVEGSVEATDRRGALMAIERLGHVPVSVAEKTVAREQEKKERAARKSFLVLPGAGRKMSSRDVLIFTTELSDLLASGMTLGNALNSLANRKTGGTADRIVAELREQFAKGWPLCTELGPWRGRQLAFVLRWHAASLSSIEAAGFDLMRAKPSGGYLRLAACVAAAAAGRHSPV